MKKLAVTSLVLIAALGAGTILAQSPADLNAHFGEEWLQKLPDVPVVEDGETRWVKRCASPAGTAEERALVSAELETWAQLREAAPETRGRLRVPVAFHVITKGNRGDVTDEQIQAQIDVLNDSFRKAKISFYIDSIDRTKKSSWYRKCFPNNRKFDQMTKRLSIDPATTLNIYTCGMSEALGVAFLPWAFPEDDYWHGVLAHHGTLPGGDFAPYNEGDTIVHEVGHYLGLYHTFQNGCADPGDEVSDTPAEASPAFGCPTGRDTCAGGGADPITNFMDYTDDACMDEFTKRQRRRMSDSISLYKPSLGT